jgi:TolB protein
MSTMRIRSDGFAIGCALPALFACVDSSAHESASSPEQTAPAQMEIIGTAELFAPGVVSTDAAEVRLTLSPDGTTAAWFTRDRAGGAGGYDIWISRRAADGWSAATPVPFNSARREFDPAFSADGRALYFCSDRPGGLGGDDIYRVSITSHGFGQPEHLGPQVNSSGNEWAPMLSADGDVLLFSSNGRGGAGRFDLFGARRLGDNSFAPAAPLPGTINTAADEFDATFLADDTSVVFSRAPDLQVDRIVLVYASLREGRYDAGTVLPATVNAPDQNTYGPMLDWSRTDRLTISSKRPDAQHAGKAVSTDLYTVRYRLHFAEP